MDPGALVCVDSELPPVVAPPPEEGPGPTPGPVTVLGGALLVLALVSPVVGRSDSK